MAHANESSDPHKGPRRALGIGSLALTLLGAAVLFAAVLAREPRPIAWLAVLCGAAGLVGAGIWSGVADARRRAPLLDEAEASPRARAAIAIGVAAALLAQAVIPLRYYLGDDSYDERFSWRMFSAVRMHECDLRAEETVGGAPREVPLMQTIHAGWVTTLRRNREAVMERYLRWRCEQPGVESARLINGCTSPSGERVPTILRNLDCASGELERQGGLP